jgi:Mannosyltransferase (PIG-V)
VNADPQRPLFTHSDLVVGLCAYAISTTLVLLSAWFGMAFVKPSSLSVEPGFDFWFALDRWDGAYYRDIARDGYHYDPSKQGVVAFFPAYPLLIRAGVLLTGARVEIAAVVIAHLLTALSCILLHAYARLRLADVRMAGLAVLGFAVLPTTVFFRLGYSESTFFFFVVLFLLGLERGWSWIVLALITGAATATRSPGVALLPPLLLEIWRRHPTRRMFLPRAALAVPLACWGLLAFVGYQWHAFDEPLAFAKIQKNWGGIGGEFKDTLVPLATYEPGWGTYVPGSPRHWQQSEFHDRAVFSIRFANPIFFTGTLLLVLFGAWRGLLHSREWLLALALLAIPYFTRGYTGSMGSFGRFAAVVVPVYIVSGWLLAKMPAWLTGLIVAACTIWLCVYAMLFTAGWQIT